MLSLFHFSAAAALSAAVALSPAACSTSGSVQIQSHESGCISIQGGEVKWTLEGSVLKLDAAAAGVQVDQAASPACEGCLLTGKIRVHVDGDGDGVVDPGDEVLDSTINDPNSQTPGVKIKLGGLQLNNAGSSSKIVVTYDIKDCLGNTAKRTVKLG